MVVLFKLFVGHADFADLFFEAFFLMAPARFFSGIATHWARADFEVITAFFRPQFDNLGIGIHAVSFLQRFCSFLHTSGICKTLGFCFAHVVVLEGNVVNFKLFGI
jgi:hypothetical protein